MLDPRALHERIEVEDVDEERASAVGGRGDRPRKVFLADQGRDREDLALLEVRAVNGELSQGPEARVHGRRSYRRHEPQV